MNATGLPIPTSSAPAAPTTEAAASPVGNANGQAPTDFMLALAQMLGTAVPATNVEAQVATQFDAETDLDETDDEAVLALLSLPVAPLQPQMLQPQSVQADADPLEMLGLGAKPDGPSARDAALMQALTERLAASEETPVPESNVTNPAFQPTVDPQAPVRTTADGAVQRPIHVPVGSQGWAEEVGSRLTLMTQKGEHTASLRLSPENLGPLEIRIAMKDDQASVWFGAAHADTRAAIENALPKLRDMFTAQGMSLADAGVFREPPRQQMPTFTGSSNSPAAADAADTVSAPVQVKLGLLDAYA